MFAFKKHGHYDSISKTNNMFDVTSKPRRLGMNGPRPYRKLEVMHTLCFTELGYRKHNWKAKFQNWQRMAAATAYHLVPFAFISPVTQKKTLQFLWSVCLCVIWPQR